MSASNNSVAMNPDVARLLEILGSTPIRQSPNASLQYGQTNTFPSPNVEALSPVVLPTAGGGRGIFSNIPGIGCSVSHDSSTMQSPLTTQQIQQQQPMPFTNTFSDSQPKPRVDPSTITNWPAALKYVMGTLAQDELVMNKLNRMKTNQDENERRWWASREAIVQKHRARVEGKRRVEELLRDMGSSITTDAGEISTAKAEAEELEKFDLKVFKAACDMEIAMSAELLQLGVPFFCGGPGGTIRLNGEYGLEEEELRGLRRRMLEMLRDMVAED